MTTAARGLRPMARGVLGCVLVMVVGCSEVGPRLQLQVPRAPRNAAALNPMTPSVQGTATFDAPVIALPTWNGAPVGPGSFTVATTPTATGGPSSIAFLDPQSTDRYVLLGDFSATTGKGLALISDTAWVLGSNSLNGLGRTAVLFDVSTGNVTDVARSGVVNLTAVGTSVGQRVTGSLSASFVPASGGTPGCVVDADCGMAQVCQRGTCVAAPSGCTSNAQCPSGRVCQAGACVVPPPVDAGSPACVVDSDCGSGQQCRSGACVAPTACMTNAQCQPGESCISGQCVTAPVACMTSAQCAPGQSCVAGQCVTSPSGCTSSAQCLPGETCVSGQCVTSPAACMTSAQCARGQTCVSGQCVAGPTGCTSSAQCQPGETCVSGQCVAGPTGCTSSAQCQPGETCVSGQCVVAPTGCTSSAQCPRGQVCQANVCVASTPATCVGRQGTGQYSGQTGAVAMCSAIGASPLSLTGALAAIDQDQGQLALFVVDPVTQRDGLVIELTACPAAPGSVTAAATLYTTTQSGAVRLSAAIAGTATVQWTQVGLVTSGTFSVTLANGGSVSGSFTVQ